MLTLEKLYFRQKRNLLEPGNDGGGGGEGEPAANPSGGEAPKGDPPGGGQGLPEWKTVLESLPEDIRSDSSFEPITSLEGLAKSYMHAQRSMGKNKISIPDKHSDVKDWKEVFHKLGNPEDIKDYSVNMPEGFEFDEGVFGAIKQVAHESGVLPWQLDKVLATYAEKTNEIIQAQENEYNTKIEEGISSLKKSWGDKFDDQVKVANTAMRHFLPDEEAQKELIQGAGGANPALLRLLANVGETLSEDAFIGQGTNRPGGMTPEQALQRAREIQGDPNHPYRVEHHPNHKQAREEVQNLYKIAYPD